MTSLKEEAKQLGYHYPNCLSPLWQLSLFRKNIFLRQGNCELHCNRLGVFEAVLERIGKKLGKTLCIEWNNSISQVGGHYAIKKLKRWIVYIWCKRKECY